LPEFEQGKKGINTKENGKRNHHETQDGADTVSILQMADINPHGLTARDVTHLQRTVGNQVVSQLFTSRPVQAMGVIQTAGYTPEQLVEILKTIPGVEDGICNALAAAWLSGQIEAEGRTLGVTAKNLNVIVALKKLLDITTHSQYRFDSRDITWAFLPYFQSKGAGWLRSLAEMPYDKIFDEARAFRDWIFDKHGGYQPSKKMVETKVAGRYNHELNQKTIRQKMDDALEEQFNLGTPFKGIVTFKMSNTKDSDIHFGHELAIRHIISEDRINNHFMIYDQNSGVTDERITSDDDIIAIFAEYIYEHYIDFPVPNTDFAEISIMIDFGG
jgi:hypothetical protein